VDCDSDSGDDDDVGASSEADEATRSASATHSD
jgi:hypothetical protein